MRLDEADHARVTVAVTAAERTTDGEIVTIVARESDAYRDVALHWAVLAMLLVIALLASFPAIPERLYRIVGDTWAEPPPISALYTLALVLVTAAFLVVRLLLASRPLRLAVTPQATRARRVRRRALVLFGSAVEARTRSATGVLLYLSLAERRAEIVADAAIHDRVAPETWGAAMAALVAAVGDGRPADGMIAAVERIGAVLAEHFPRSTSDRNELPDRLIEL